MMMVVIVQAALPVRGIDDKVSALMLLVGLLLWNFKLHFGSAQFYDQSQIN
jgi:hypothetical protein